jgi:V8-like Glu-specific endopeptidase
MEKNVSTFLKVYGYPYDETRYPNYSPTIGDKSEKNFTIFQYGLERSSRIKQIKDTKDIVFYLISTHPGQSGSPLIFDRDYIGVHIRGNNKQKSNDGRLFDSEMINRLVSWGK